MSKGITKTGFQYEVDDKKVDDYELLELLAAVEEDVTKYPKLFKFLLGEKQLSRLKEHLHKIDGYVSMKKIEKEVAYIISSTKDLKN
jgi:hypothetical protein